MPDNSFAVSAAVGVGALLIWTSLVAGLLAAEADIFVAPNGNDQWTGHLAAPNEQGTDGPVATLTRAQQLVRDIKAAQPDRSQPIVVAIRGGIVLFGRALVVRCRGFGHREGTGHVSGLW